jgi:hypothetical protein
MHQEKGYAKQGNTHCNKEYSKAGVIQLFHANLLCRFVRLRSLAILSASQIFGGHIQLTMKLHLYCTRWVILLPLHGDTFLSPTTGCSPHLQFRIRSLACSFALPLAV